MAKSSVKKKSAPAHDHSRVLTEDGRINISQSKVKSWRRCRRQYHNKFVLGIRKKIKSRPLTFGSLIHECIEAIFEGEDFNEVLDEIEVKKLKIFKEEREMYGDIIEDVRDIATAYEEYWEDSKYSVKPIKHKGRRSEHEFRIELDDDLWFTGRIDAVVKSRGMRWVMEHKSFSRMPSEDERWRSVQAAVYFRALEMMGFKEIDGVLWDYISSKPPLIPKKKLKDGSWSQAKLDTVPARIRRFLEEEELKKKNYKKLMAVAEANLPNRYIRIFSPVKRRIVDNIWDDFKDTAREIQEFHGKKKDQNIERHCSWCDYQALCKAEVTGSDIDWLLKRDYIVDDEIKGTNDGKEKNKEKGKSNRRKKGKKRTGRKKRS